jgi:hypothetical protein
MKEQTEKRNQQMPNEKHKEIKQDPSATKAANQSPPAKALRRNSKPVHFPWDGAPKSGISHPRG